jgi:hypothetical protein
LIPSFAVNAGSTNQRAVRIFRTLIEAARKATKEK